MRKCVVKNIPACTLGVVSKSSWYVETVNLDYNVLSMGLKSVTAWWIAILPDIDSAQTSPTIVQAFRAGRK